MYYKESQTKLGYLEFEEVFLENLDSITITSLKHIEENKDFYDEIVFKCFDLYQRETSNFSVNDSLKFFHIFLYSAFKHRPNVEKEDDVIKLF
jgi:hypothetical protein